MTKQAIVWGLTHFNEYGSSYRTDYFLTEAEAIAKVYSDTGGYTGYPYATDKAQAETREVEARECSDVWNQVCCHWVY
jgi:hypothetical protein